MKNNSSLNNDIEINSDDKIKAFIKLEYSELIKKDIYEVDESKKFITIYNLETTDQPKEKKSYPFEFNKIFMNNDTNAYIYEEICLNCIKQIFEGISFTFISFGESKRDKINLLLGKIDEDYNNINHDDLLIRYLKDLIHKNRNYNYNIKLTSIIIYEDKIIDLYDLFNKNIKSKNNFNFLKKAINIGKDMNIINKINKFDIFNDNDINTIILFLHDLINSLSKLKNKNNKNDYLYSLSNICFLINLEDKSKNIISTSTFLLLNGCEHLYDINDKKTKKKEEISISKSVKNSLNIQITYDGIINCIKNNKYIIESIYKKNEQTKDEKNSSNKDIETFNKSKKEIKLPSREDGFNEEISRFSKLIIALYNICFSKELKNIKFRIIGNISPIIENYTSTRDTLLFCSKCYNILNKPNVKLILSDEGKKKYDIDDLNFQIKLYKSKIDSLNHMLERKNIHINFLSKNYNAQIEAIKKYFDFKDDPNKLITGDINLEEDNYMKNIKYRMKKQEKEIKDYKIKIEELEQELFKYQNISSIKITDQTMISYYLSAKNKNIQKNLENKLINSLNKEIIELNEKINHKDKIIEGLNKDLNDKNQIFCHLHENLIKNNKNEKEIGKNKEKDEKIINGRNVLNLKNEIKKMKIDMQNNIKTLKDKYNYIINEQKDNIDFIQKKLDNIEMLYKTEIEELNKELVKLYEIILNLMNSYKNIFEENNSEEYKINQKKKEEFDLLIFNLDNDLNYLSFSSLYKELKKENKTRHSIIESLTKDNINKINKIISNNFQPGNEITNKNKLEKFSSKEMEITDLSNKLKSMSNYLKDQVKQNNQNNIIINSQNLTIEKLRKSALLYENLLKNKITERNLSNNSYYSSNSKTRRKLISKNIIKNINKYNNSKSLSLNYVSEIQFNDKISTSDKSIIRNPTNKKDINAHSIVKNNNIIKSNKKFFYGKKIKRPFSSDNLKIIHS